jgi:hypothetical protein
MIKFGNVCCMTDWSGREIPGKVLILRIFDSTIGRVHLGSTLLGSPGVRCAIFRKTSYLSLFPFGLIL